LNGSFAASKKNGSGITDFAAARRRGQISIPGCDGITRSAHIKRCSIGVLVNIARNKAYRWLDFRGALQPFKLTLIQIFHLLQLRIT
jgi:hypothetical protein